MIVIDLTLSGDNGEGRAFHGGGDYGISAADFIVRNTSTPVILFLRVGHGGDFAALREHKHVQVREVEGFAPFVLPDELDAADVRVFLPLPYEYLARGSAPRKAKLWFAIHGLRAMELARMRAQFNPVEPIDPSRGLVDLLRSGLRSVLRARRAKRDLPFEESRARYYVDLIRQGHRLLVPSIYTRDSLRFYAHVGREVPIHVLPPLSAFHEHSMPGTGAEANIGRQRKGVLLLSAERREKNIARVLQGLDSNLALRQILVKEEFFVTGSKDFMGSLPERTAGGVRINRLGYCSAERLWQLMESVSMLIYPSVSEGYGIPPVMAFRLGTPVVASPFASIPEVCADAAVYCNPFDIDDIAVKAFQILSDDGMYRRLQDAGRARYAVLGSKARDSWHAFLAAEAVTTGGGHGAR